MLASLYSIQLMLKYVTVSVKIPHTMQAWLHSTMHWMQQSDYFAMKKGTCITEKNLCNIIIPKKRGVWQSLISVGTHKETQDTVLVLLALDKWCIIIMLSYCPGCRKGLGDKTHPVMYLLKDLMEQCVMVVCNNDLFVKIDYLLLIRAHTKQIT